MKMKKWYTIIFALFLASHVVSAVVDCDISTDNSTWENVTWGAFDEDGMDELALIIGLERNTRYYLRCNDETEETAWGYTTFVTGDDEMSDVAITLFLLLSASVIFFIPFILDLFKKTFVNNEILNLVIRRGFFITGINLMTLNSTFIAEMASNANLSTGVIFQYTWIFGMIGYVLTLILILKTLMDIISIMRDNKLKERFE